MLKGNSKGKSSACIHASDLAEQEKALLESLAPTNFVAGGSLIKFPKSYERQIVYLFEGALKLVGHVSAGREQIVSYAFPGEIVVLPPVTLAPYELYALSDSRLSIFPARTLFRAAASGDEAGSAILDRALVTIDRLREKAVLLGRKTAKERIATFLLTMAERIGEKSGSSIQLTLPMSRREIADSLGLTIETVSRQLTELRDSQMIATSGRSDITMLDEAGLRALCESSRLAETLSN